MNKKLFNLVLAGILAGLYLILTLPFAQFAFGIIQFRLAEAMAVLPALTPAAIPGVFIGCLLSNFFNPQNLGPIDIIGGSLTTLLSAYLTYKIAEPLRRYLKSDQTKLSESNRVSMRKKSNVSRFLALLPPIVLNGLIVGTYLTFLLVSETPSFKLLAISILSVTVSQSIVIYGLGLPLLIGLSRNKAIISYI